MPECSNAYPTEELLQELRSFRLDKFLDLPRIYMGVAIWDITKSNLAVFFDWLQEQVRPFYVLFDSSNFDRIVDSYGSVVQITFKDVFAKAILPYSTIICSKFYHGAHHRSLLSNTCSRRTLPTSTITSF